MSTIIRGDTTYWDIPINRPASEGGGPMPLNGLTVWVTVKANPNDPDESAIYQHWITIDESGAVTGSEGMSIGPDGPEAGVIVERMTAAESAALATGTYTYDVQVMLPNNDIHTPILGASETVEADWTRATTRPGGD
jgi:hypothetical protein